MVEMIKKIVQVGNSYGITLSKEWLEYHKLRPGDTVIVNVEVNEEGIE